MRENRDNKAPKDDIKDKLVAIPINLVFILCIEIKKIHKVEIKAFFSEKKE